MLKRLNLIAPLLILLTGCATTELQVTYDSVPRGASIIQDGQMIGTTPTVIYYKVTPEIRRNEEMYLKPLTFRWISGAEYLQGSNHVPLPRSLTRGNPILYLNNTAKRPDSHPGLDKDQQYALDVERMNYQAAQQRQIQNQIAEENMKQGVRDFFDDLNDKREEMYKDALKSPTSTRCRSRESYGGSIVTDCETY